MTTPDVLSLLSANRNERGMANWEKLGFGSTGLRSFGIGLTQLRALAKKVGRDRELARELWETDVYDAKVISLLIDDPKAITREQAEAQVEEVGTAHLSHVFSSCDSSLAKVPFVVELADDWTRSDDAQRRCCGYGLLSEVAGFKGKKSPDDAYFLEHIRRIDDTILQEGSEIQLAMGNALLNIGKRSRLLNEAALKVARKAGPIEFESASGRCEPFDVEKHLTSDYVRKKLGL